MMPILKHYKHWYSVIGRRAVKYRTVVPVPLKNKLQYASTVAMPTAQEHDVKAFEDMPTKYSNTWQLVFDMFRMQRKGVLSRLDLLAIDDHVKYGNIFRTWQGSEFLVQVADPKLVETVFRAEGKYPERIEMKPWKDYRITKNIPLGLFLQDGKQWHRTRSAVSKRILKPIEMARYITPLGEVTKDTVCYLAKLRESEGDRKNIVPNLEEELFKWSMEGSVRVLLGDRLGLLSDKTDEQSLSFIGAVQDIFDTTIELFTFSGIHRRLNTKAWRRHCSGWDTVMSVTKNLIDRRVDTLVTAKENGTEPKTDNFLEALIYNSDLTREEIFGNLSELLLAAIDTTSFTLVWTFYFLARYPEVQKKLREEVCDVLPVDKEITQSDLSKLVYMKKVIKESMRLRPVIGGISRKLHRDLVLEGYQIPAKTVLVVQFYPMLHDPNIFEDPMEFQPDRWDRKSNDDSTPNPFASLPFGFGSRMCVGRRFAEMEMHLLLAEVLRKFDVVPTREVNITSRLLFIPSEPVDLKFIDRNY